MPELPELEVVSEVLQRTLLGQAITEVVVRPPGGPIVVRDLTLAGFERSLTGATFARITRRGKFLIFGFEPPAEFFLVFNPKLTGRWQLAAPTDKRQAKTHVIFSLANGRELRYMDQKTMGQLYLTRDLNQVPEYAGLGPEPFDISLEDFRARLKPYRGEIKGVLTRGEFIAGIGNAYADEILWVARLHPYRKRTQLTAEEVERLYDAIGVTLRDATAKVRAEMGDQIQREPRGFMAVHLKAGEPCPRCGSLISVVSANQRITNF
jgi:formamidopyrimidine-DNA glycosylase